MNLAKSLVSGPSSAEQAAFPLAYISLRSPHLQISPEASHTHKLQVSQEFFQQGFKIFEQIRRLKLLTLQDVVWVNEIEKPFFALKQ